MLWFPCPAYDGEAGSVGGTIDDAMIGFISRDLVPARNEGFVAGAYDFVLPAEDFRGREKIAELIDDFGCGDEFGEEISIFGFKLSGGDGLQPVGFAAKDCAETEVGHGGGVEDSIVRDA